MGYHRPSPRRPFVNLPLALVCGAVMLVAAVLSRR